jgi:pentatricopeptide repeat protein
MTALSVYEWMKAPASAGGAALSPTVYTYTAAMRAALAAGLLDRALAVWEDAQAAECPLDCRLCITYIEVSRRLVVSSGVCGSNWLEQLQPCHVLLQGAVHASACLDVLHCCAACMQHGFTLQAYGLPASPCKLSCSSCMVRVFCV